MGWGGGGLPRGRLSGDAIRWPPGGAGRVPLITPTGRPGPCRFMARAALGKVPVLLHRSSLGGGEAILCGGGGVAAGPWGQYTLGPLAAPGRALPGTAKKPSGTPLRRRNGASTGVNSADRGQGGGTLLWFVPGHLVHLVHPPALRPATGAPITWISNPTLHSPSADDGLPLPVLPAPGSYWWLLLPQRTRTLDSSSVVGAAMNITGANSQRGKEELHRLCSRVQGPLVPLECDPPTQITSGPSQRLCWQC